MKQYYKGHTQQKFYVYFPKKIFYQKMLFLPKENFYQKLLLYYIVLLV